MVSAVEAWPVSIAWPPWSPLPSAGLGRGQVGCTPCSIEGGSLKLDVDSFFDFSMYIPGLIVYHVYTFSHWFTKYYVLSSPDID